MPPPDLSPGPHPRRWFVPAMLLAVLIFIAGKLLLTPVRGAEYRTEFSTIQEYQQGWPWVFRSEFRHAIPVTMAGKPWPEPTIWPGYLCADVVVLLFLVAFVAIVALWHCRKYGRWLRFSLRSLVIFTILIAGISGWLSFEYRQSKREAELIPELSERHIDCLERKYCGPEWLRRLLPESSLGMFQRAVEICLDDRLYPPYSPSERTQTLQSALPHFRSVHRLVAHSSIAADLKNSSAQAGITDFYIWDSGQIEMLADTISHWPQVAKLTVDCRGPSDMTDRALAHLADCPRLEEICIPEGELPNITDAGIAALSQSKTLRSLTLPDAPLTDAALASLAKVPTLEALSINRLTNITDAGVLELAQAPHLKAISLPAPPQISKQAVEQLQQHIAHIAIVYPDHVESLDASK